MLCSFLWKKPRPDIMPGLKAQRSFFANGQVKLEKHDEGKTWLVFRLRRPPFLMGDPAAFSNVSAALESVRMP